MGFKSAKDELKGKARELAGRVTGNEQRRRDGEAEHERAKAQGLAEAKSSTEKSTPVTDPPGPGTESEDRPSTKQPEGPNPRARDRKSPP